MHSAILRSRLSTTMILLVSFLWAQLAVGATWRVLGVDELREQYRHPYLITCEVGSDKGKICNATSVRDSVIEACCGKDDLSLADSSPPRNGLTWGKVRHDSSLGTDLISCHAGSGCDPHRGNSSCEEELPILCIKNDASPNPGIDDGQWRTWAKGHVATSMPVKGTALASFQQASLLCQQQFGEGWRMAQHHEGDHKQGWMFEAYGNVRDDVRFWIYISDTNGNCWNTSASTSQLNKPANSLPSVRPQIKWR
mgnify:CR=1 FL=1